MRRNWDSAARKWRSPGRPSLIPSKSRLRDSFQRRTSLRPVRRNASSPGMNCEEDEDDDAEAVENDKEEEEEEDGDEEVGDGAASKRLSSSEE